MNVPYQKQSFCVFETFVFDNLLKTAAVSSDKTKGLISVIFLFSSKHTPPPCFVAFLALCLRRSQLRSFYFIFI